MNPSMSLSLHSNKYLHGQQLYSLRSEWVCWFLVSDCSCSSFAKRTPQLPSWIVYGSKYLAAFFQKRNGCSWMFTLFLFWNPAPYLAFKVHKSNRLESPWKLRFDVLFVGEVSSQMPESPPSYWRGWEDAGNLQMNKAAAHGIPDEIRGTKPDTVLEGHEVLGWDMFRPWGMDGNSGHKNVGLFIGITEDQWIHPDSGLSFTIGWWYTAYFCPLNDGKHDDKQLIFFWGLHQTHVVTTIFMCETVINILAKD